MSTKDVMKIVSIDGQDRYIIDSDNHVTDLRKCQHVTDGEHLVCLTCEAVLTPEEFSKCPTI